MAKKTGVPGPGAYRLKENTCKFLPVCRRADRFNPATNRGNKAGLPLCAAKGDFVRSSWPTPAHFKFGTAHRDAGEKAYLGTELANTGYGK